MTVPAGTPQRPAAHRRRSAARLVGVFGLLTVGAALVGCVPESQGAPPQATATGTPAGTPTQGPAQSPSPLPTDDVVPEPSPTAAGPPTVTIVNYGADDHGVHASGLVTGDAGAAGTCVLTATSPSGESLSAELEATPTPAAMNCGLIDIAVPAGQWTLVLSYISESGRADSEATKVTRR